MVIFRTSPDPIDNVVKHNKHALNSRPSLTPGETILISQTVSKTNDGKPPIRYAMEYVNMYRDEKGESKSIWGKQWTYILQGKNCRPLKKPFNISHYQVSSENYGPGGPVKYVADIDKKKLQQEGLLERI